MIVRHDLYANIYIGYFLFGGGRYSENLCRMTGDTSVLSGGGKLAAATQCPKWVGNPCVFQGFARPGIYGRCARRS